MPILVTCPNCSSSLKAPDNAVGRKVKCPKCGGVIAVPAAEEEAVDLAKLGVQAEPPDAAPPAPVSRRRREDDYEDDDRSRRRGRGDDHDDDYDDEHRRRPSREAATGSGLPMGLGIASLSVGILGLLVALIPCVGALSWPVCGVGLILGVVGLLIGINKGSATGFPIAGSAVSGVALAISLIWVLLVTRVVRDANQNINQVAKEFDRAAKQMQAEAQKQQFQPGNMPIQFGNPPVGPPTPPAGAITLAGGKGQLEGELTIGDPLDRVQRHSKCKVFTVTMTAGRTYQIDMIKKLGAGIAHIDPFLRLEDSDGNHLTSDDDSGGNLNARITFACPRNGTFRVVTTTFLGGTGLFTLKVEER